MKKLLVLTAIVLATLSAGQAQAHEGSWIAAGPSFEHVANGANQNGVAGTLEGGYWYLGNVAYGGYAKGNFFSDNGNKLNIYDLGVFWKGATEAGLYGKLTAGMAFVSPAAGASGGRVGNVTSFSIGFAGGFLFSLTESMQFGPEVSYRHLTAGSGADQIGAGLLLAFAL